VVLPSAAAGAFERPEWINWSIIVAGVGLVLIIPIRNLYTFGNPLYPVAWSLFGHSFPGPYPSNLSDHWDPAYLRGTAQPLKWILSILEFHALDSRYTPYTLGMADVGPDAKSLRMGGYFGFYVVFNLLVLAYIVFRKRDRRAYLFAAAFLIGSVATASLPASHELRYFLLDVDAGVRQHLLCFRFIFPRSDAALCAVRHRNLGDDVHRDGERRPLYHACG